MSTRAGRDQQARRTLVLAGALVGALSWNVAARAESPDDVPPVRLTQFPVGAPSPQWDLGILVGVSGQGKDQLWTATDFSLGLVSDVLFLRKHTSSVGLGTYLGLETSGFFDTRIALGVTTTLPLSELFVLQARVGPALLAAGDGADLGFDVDLELGARGLSRSGHYSMTHAFCLGVQHFPGEQARAGTALLLRLRLDAFWLLLPVALVR